jgi:hypothetical protein
VNATDVWQFVEQVPVQFIYSRDMFMKEVPTFAPRRAHTTGITGLVGAAMFSAWTSTCNGSFRRRTKFDG